MNKVISIDKYKKPTWPPDPLLDGYQNKVLDEQLNGLYEDMVSEITDLHKKLIESDGQSFNAWKAISGLCEEIVSLRADALRVRMYIELGILRK